MRTIKFRAWIPSQRIMAYFDLGAAKLDDGVYGEEEYKEAEIMQYTGLKDRNGKEIYEGDVLEYKVVVCEGNPNRTAMVYWDEKEAQFRMKGERSVKIQHHPEAEILGHIYDEIETTD